MEYEDETGMEVNISSSGTELSSSGTEVMAVKRVPSMKMLKTLTSSWRKEFCKNQKTYVKCSVCCIQRFAKHTLWVVCQLLLLNQGLVSSHTLHGVIITLRYIRLILKQRGMN